MCKLWQEECLNWISELGKLNVLVIFQIVSKVRINLRNCCS